MIETYSDSMLLEIQTTPGEEIRRLLSEYQITQLEFYEKTGFINSDLSRIINGKKNVTPKIAKVLAEGFSKFGIVTEPINWLFFQAVKDLKDYEAK